MRATGDRIDPCRYNLPTGTDIAVIIIVILFAATGLTDNCTTSTTVHNRVYSVLYKFSSSISRSIISHFSSSIQYHKCSLNKTEPEFNSWGSYAVTGTEITEKGKLLCNI